MDLIVRNARLRGLEELVDIGIEQGKIVKIEKDIAERGVEEIDARGKLVIPSFIDPHLHLDIAFTVGEPRYNMTGSHPEAIEIWSERKAKLTLEDVKTRAAKAIECEVAHGTTRIRTHVDVCDPNLTALKAILEIKKEYADLVDLQVVAFPQEGVLSYPGAHELIMKSIELGVDVVGGIPHCEWTREDGVEEIEFLFDVAKRYNRDIDMHCDETDDDYSRYLEVLASKTMREKYFGRVTASHTTAMHSYNNWYAFRLIDMVKRAQINVVVNPLDNTVLQGRFDTYPKRRGITRVKELLEAGVNVCIGHDSIMDAWYPFGVGDILQSAFMLLHVGHMTGYDELLKVFDMVTVNSAKTLRVTEEYGIEVGKKADLVVIDAYNEIDALRTLPPRLYVIKDGKIVAKTTPSKSKVYHRGVEKEIEFTK